MISYNVEASRFELREQGKLAFATYGVYGNILSLLHVEADPTLRGQGTAARLMDGLLHIIRDKGMKVRPVCGYAVSYIQGHPCHAYLLEPEV